MKFSIFRNRYIISLITQTNKTALVEISTRDETSKQEIGVFQHVLHIIGNFLRLILVINSFK